MARCPRCEGPGGVELLFEVSPCDPCYARDRRVSTPVEMTVPSGRHWVIFQGHPGCEIEGMIGWDSWSERVSQSVVDHYIEDRKSIRERSPEEIFGGCSSNILLFGADKWMDIAGHRGTIIVLVEVP